MKVRGGTFHTATGQAIPPTLFLVCKARMSELLIPERARLAPKRPEESQSNGRANDLNLDWSSERRNQHHYNLFWVQKALSFFILEAPSLPIANPHDTRNLRIGENIPLRYLGWTSQRDRQDRMSFNHRNSHEVRASNGERVEERRSSLKSRFIMKDGRKIAHNARKDALVQQLQSMLGDNTDTLVLVCWGEKYHCSIIPVRISDPVDEVATWREIRQAWYSHRGYWRRYVPFFSVEHVDIVELSIAGINSERQTGSGEAVEFVGMYTVEDFHAKKKQLEGIIENYQEQDFPCPYNLSTGMVDCLEVCVSGITDERCPEAVMFEAERELQNLETCRLMKLAFSNPKLAALNEFLQPKKMVYGHRDILMKMNEWHCPKLRELKFHGIMIREDWKIGSKHIMFSLAMSLLFFMVIAAKIIFGDWGTAWTVGCFFLSLASFLCGWAK